jgi:hypothetical protein
MKIGSYIVVSAVIFTLVAIVHLVRLLQGWPAEIDMMSVPLWASGLCAALGVAMAGWGFSFLRRT